MRKNWAEASREGKHKVWTFAYLDDRRILSFVFIKELIFQNFDIIKQSMQEAKEGPEIYLCQPSRNREIEKT